MDMIVSSEYILLVSFIYLKIISFIISAYVLSNNVNIINIIMFYALVYHRKKNISMLLTSFQQVYWVHK